MTKNNKKVSKGGESGEYEVPGNGEVWEANWHDDTPTEEEIEAEEVEKGEEEGEIESGASRGEVETLEEEEEVVTELTDAGIDYEYYGDEKGYDSERDADGNMRKTVTLDAARRIGRIAML